MKTPVSERRSVVFRGRVFRVERDRVRLPQGQPVTMEIVRHRGSVVLIPTPAPGRLILIRQFRYAVGRWLWELPAGTLEPGEPAARAARRECLEETGWLPSVLRRLGSYYPTPGFCDERMTFYVCGGLTKPPRPRPGDPDEQITSKVFTEREAWDLVDRGAVRDMKTILGLTLLQRRGKRQQAAGKRPR